MGNETDLDWLDSTGDRGYKKTDREAIKNSVVGKAAALIELSIKKAIDYKLVNSGTLTSNDGYKFDAENKNGITNVDIFIIFYGLFQDRGVQGFLKQDNAPDSPYKFKHGKISDEGLENIKDLIKSGRAKIRDESKTKYGKIGLETKAMEETGDPIEREARTLAYFIKAYGIKTRPFFGDAYRETFGNEFNYELWEAVKKQWVAQLKKLNNQK